MATATAAREERSETETTPRSAKKEGEIHQHHPAGSGAAMVRQLCPCGPTGDHRDAEMHLKPKEEPTPEVWMPETNLRTLHWRGSWQGFLP